MFVCFCTYSNTIEYKSNLRCLLRAGGLSAWGAGGSLGQNPNVPEAGGGKLRYDILGIEMFSVIVGIITMERRDRFEVNPESWTQLKGSNEKGI